ncbi:MAG: helix-turn-helix domain-containing protein [Dehalococcoidales bacterium]|nr:helix-turn-helix domain-containing protein [Dehalococcoidales bacterium]
MSFAKRLKQLRNSYRPKIYQKELADALGVSRQAITMWETGQRTPDPKMLQRIADYFDVSVDYLLKGPKKNAFLELINDGIPSEIRPFATDHRNYPLIKAIQSAQQEGLSSEAILCWIEDLKNSLIAQKEKYDHIIGEVVIAKDNPTPEDLEMVEKLKERMKDPEFKRKLLEE